LLSPAIAKSGFSLYLPYLPQYLLIFFLFKPCRCNIWAAKYTARHLNLVALELSSFKCGHDAPIYTVVEEIVSSGGTPYFSFKDIHENKPTGSIKIRVETIHYFLTRYREDFIANKRSP